MRPRRQGRTMDAVQFDGAVREELFAFARNMVGMSNGSCPTVVAPGGAFRLSKLYDSH